MPIRLTALAAAVAIACSGDPGAPIPELTSSQVQVDAGAAAKAKCEPTTAACNGKCTGTSPDGCGGMIRCCPEGNVCDTLPGNEGFCCAPNRTQCEACGMAPDGCGGLIGCVDLCPEGDMCVKGQCQSLLPGCLLAGVWYKVCPR